MNVQFAQDEFYKNEKSWKIRISFMAFKKLNQNRGWRAYAEALNKNQNTEHKRHISQNSPSGFLKIKESTQPNKNYDRTDSDVCRRWLFVHLSAFGRRIWRGDIDIYRRKNVGEITVIGLRINQTLKL